MSIVAVNTYITSLCDIMNFYSVINLLRPGGNIVHSVLGAATSARTRSVLVATFSNNEMLLTSITPLGTGRNILCSLLSLQLLISFNLQELFYLSNVATTGSVACTEATASWTVFSTEALLTANLSTKIASNITCAAAFRSSSFSFSARDSASTFILVQAGYWW